MLLRLIEKSGGDDRDFDALVEWLDPDNPLSIIDAIQTAPDMEARLFIEEDDKPALTRLLTTHTEHININTASREVLDALWDQRSLTDAILRRRAKTPFADTADIRRFLATAQVDDDVLALSALLDARSAYFTVCATPSDRGDAHALKALVRRTDDDVVVLRVERGAKEMEP